MPVERVEMPRFAKILSPLSWFVPTAMMFLLSLSGCSGDVPSQTTPDQIKRPLRKMQSAAGRGQWQDAWRYADAVLAQYPSDSEAIALVARVAQQLEKPGRVADLLMQACRAESFSDADRVKQTMVAMISVGRLHDGMQWLEEVVATQPQQYSTRRWLFDLYVSSEDRFSAAPHGQILVRQRQFDAVLLLALGNQHHRTKNLDFLHKLVSRSPDDQRPLIREAYLLFDSKKYEQAIEQLRSIVASHPDFLPAQTMLGNSLASAGRMSDLRNWAKAVESDEIKARPGYWAAIGEGVLATKGPTAAVRPYWEATVRDPNVADYWSKLAKALDQADLPGDRVARSVVDAAMERALLLRNLDRSMEKFQRSGRISRQLAVETAETLTTLGRIWEAEAWASLATTLPEDDLVDVQEVRTKIVDRLTAKTPWQISDGHPELQLDLSDLDEPLF